MMMDKFQTASLDTMIDKHIGKPETERRKAFETELRIDLLAKDVIKAVTSKSGTTEAALRQFEAGHLDETLKDGIIAPQVRSSELSKG